MGENTYRLLKSHTHWLGLIHLRMY